ncbi:MAG: RHS repeat-associated core domain-containing protein, partial [Bacteroidota bacterium]
PSPFLGVWKRDRLKESQSHFFEVLDEKWGQQKNCINYYPGGFTFNEHQRTASVKNKWKFQSKEWLPELRVYDFGPRGWDPLTWRTNAQDILADQFPDQSPYSLFRNNPIRYSDPDGRFPIDIHIRSFAPFENFGFGIWKGDNRGFSNSLDASSRIRQVSSYETTTRSGRTRAYGNLSSSIYGAFAYSEAYVNGGQSASIENGNINTHLYGNNDALFIRTDGTPIDGGPSWDIDVHSDLSIDVADGENGNQILSIVGSVSGDQFPNAEGFVNDADGNSIFLGAFVTESGSNNGPFVTLMGDKNKQMFNVNISIQVNQEGIFQGVMQGDKLISIDEWNKQFDDN